MKWIGWPIFILFVSFLIGLFIYDKTMEIGRIEALDSNLSSSKLIGQLALEDFPQATIHYEKEIYEKSETYYEWPVFSNQELTAQVLDWLEEQRKQGARNISLEKRKVDNDYYQFLLEAEIGDERIILPFLVDINEGLALSLEDLFLIDENFMESFSSLLKENSKKEISPDKFPDLDQIYWLLDEESLTVYLENSFQIKEAADHKIKLALSRLVTHAKDSFIERNSMLAAIVAAEEEERRAEEERKRREEEERRRKEKEKQEQRPAGSVGKYVAFTFDDGPHPEVTPWVLDILNKYGAKGTFFMLGSEVGKYPNIVKRIAAEGHELGNHSHNHPDLTKMDYASVERQFSGTRNMIEEITGIRTPLFRPPYGAVNSQVISAADNTGSSLILWSVDSRDWESRHAGAVYNQVMATVTGGSIILMHDLYPSTAEALERILRDLKEQGFQFVTVSELLQRAGKSGAGPHRGV